MKKKSMIIACVLAAICCTACGKKEIHSEITENAQSQSVIASADLNISSSLTEETDDFSDIAPVDEPINVDWTNAAFVVDTTQNVATSKDGSSYAEGEFLRASLTGDQL